MKPKSVSGFVCYVKDLKKTVEFYEIVGFEFRKKDETHATAYLNWYSIDFVSSEKEQKEEFLKEANAENKGAGLYIMINVEDVDSYYQYLLKNGIQPSSEPRDWPWGNREFVVRDPDGYKLVFFQKK